ncbi:MAG: hypothetical protein KatS3mg119_1322 [Rhodothalassiaceae bacterium]|nr:MAG: hypothetical protein KatS3mg119_1322 [Rhodothalassiaceae bacterium]
MASATAGVNGLDQLASSGGTALSYDGRGNLAGRGAWGYAHDVENNLTQVTGPVNLTLAYDALGRLERLIESGQDTRFLYDGAQVIAELDAASGAVKRRYVPGPGTNEVVAWYEGAGVGERRFIHQDERGSVVAVTNGAGAAIATFRYGPWGESSDTAPGSGAGTGFSRFGYTGAIRLPGTDLLHMRARVHATALARLLEPDPIGFASGQLNLYAYVGNDPINGVDPSGLMEEDDDDSGDDDGVIENIVTTGKRIALSPESVRFAIALSNYILDDLMQSLAMLGFSPSQIDAICNSDPKDPDKATFPTREEAAANAIKWAVKMRGNARESGGLLYQTANGRFRATVAPVGTEQNVEIDIPQQIPSNLVGIYHIHPPGGGSDLSTIFNAPYNSADTRVLGILDKAIFSRTGQLLIVYLGTPDGGMKKYIGPFLGTAVPPSEQVLPEGCLYGEGGRRR